MPGTNQLNEYIIESGSVTSMPNYCLTVSKYNYLHDEL